MPTQKSKSKVLYGAIAGLGAVTAVFPFAIYHLVETAGSEAMAMACESACIAEALVGAVIALIAIASLFIQNAKLGLSASAALLAGGVAAIAVPQLIGFCKSEEMACRYITAPTLAILGSAIIVLAGVKLVTGALALRRSVTA
jgi:hypothetical protein